MQVLAGVTGASKCRVMKHFFSSKCDEYQVWQILKTTSTKVWLYFFKALARWLSWLEGQPIHQKDVSSIPGRDTYGRQPMFFSHLGVSLSLTHSLPSSLSKKQSTYPQVWIKKRKKKYFYKNKNKQYTKLVS